MAVISLPLAATASCPSTSRCRLAQAETRCRAGPSARRDVLPSMATMSGSASSSAATQAMKHSAKSRAGNAFITSPRVSCAGTPWASGSIRRRKSRLRFAQRSISAKSSAPAIVPQSTIKRTSGSG